MVFIKKTEFSDEAKIVDHLAPSHQGDTPIVVKTSTGQLYTSKNGEVAPKVEAGPNGGKVLKVMPGLAFNGQKYIINPNVVPTTIKEEMNDQEKTVQAMESAIFSLKETNEDDLDTLQTISGIQKTVMDGIIDTVNKHEAIKNLPKKQKSIAQYVLIQIFLLRDNRFEIQAEEVRKFLHKAGGFFGSKNEDSSTSDEGNIHDISTDSQYDALMEEANVYNTRTSSTSTDSEGGEETVKEDEEDEEEMSEKDIEEIRSKVKKCQDVLLSFSTNLDERQANLAKDKNGEEGEEVMPREQLDETKEKDEKNVQDSLDILDQESKDIFSEYSASLSRMEATLASIKEATEELEREEAMENQKAEEQVKGGSNSEVKNDGILDLPEENQVNNNTEEVPSWYKCVDRDELKNVQFKLALKSDNWDEEDQQEDDSNIKERLAKLEGQLKKINLNNKEKICKNNMSIVKTEGRKMSKRKRMNDASINKNSDLYAKVSKIQRENYYIKQCLKEATDSTFSMGRKEDPKIRTCSTLREKDQTRWCKLPSGSDRMNPNKKHVVKLSQNLFDYNSESKARMATVGVIRHSGELQIYSILKNPLSRRQRKQQNRSGIETGSFCVKSNQLGLTLDGVHRLHARLGQSATHYGTYRLGPSNPCVTVWIGNGLKFNLA